MGLSFPSVIPSVDEESRSSTSTNSRHLHKKLSEWPPARIIEMALLKRHRLSFRRVL